MEHTEVIDSETEVEKDKTELRLPNVSDPDYFEAMGLVVKTLEEEHENESTTCSDLLSALLEHSEQLYLPSTMATIHTYQSTSNNVLHGYLNVNKRYGETTLKINK